MQHLVLAKPRNGKSYFVVANQKCETSLVRELENPDGRYIVTNLPIVPEEIEEFMAKRGKRIDCTKRITCLEHSQCHQFWRHRGGGYIREVPDNDPKENTELHLLQNEEVFAITGDPMHKRGVLYILDEWHVYFPGRQAMQKHPLNWVFQYGTQHGHFSDTIFLITQSLSYVEKIFREWTQDYIYLENERLRKVRGFRKGNGMVARFYQFPPTLGTEAPDDSEELPLDTEGYAKLYDTSGGAGISGGGSADKGARVKGLPLKSIWFIGAAAFITVTCLLLVGRSWIHRRLRGNVNTAVAVAPATVGGIGRNERQRMERLDPATTPVSEEPVSPGGSQPLPSLPASGQDDPPAVQQAVTWTRFVQRGPRSFVFLSDGRVITTPSRVEYDSIGVVDLVDLEGKHWRISRASMAWSATAKPAQEENK